MKYKKFKLSDLFLIESTKSLDAGQLEFVENGVNFVGRTFENNGVQGKIKRQPFEPNKANTITATVIGNYKYVKLQEEEYYCSQNINKLTPKIEGLSRRVLYYQITHIQKFVSQYNGQQGGYKLSDINNHKINLPVKTTYHISFTPILRGGNMININAYEWKSFRLDELFEKVKVNTLNYKVKDLPIYPDNVYNLPALTAGIENQGLSCFVPREGATILKNCISVSANGANTGAMFYQPNEFTILQDSYALKWKGKENIGEKEYLFLISTMQKNIRGNYDWSNKAGWERIRGVEIKLPVKEVDEIDFDFMDSLISELEEERINDFEAYLKETGLNNYSLSEEDLFILKAKKQTKDYPIGKLLEGKPGDVDLQQKDINGKGTYFINSGLTNNGIKGKTDRKAKIFPANTITIDFFGNAFYRDFEYKLATHNHVFSFSGEVIKNKQVGLYIASTMIYLRKIYSYQNMATIPSLIKNTISIPVDVKGDIDYDYMEKYISIIEKLNIKAVVDWKDKIINKKRKL